MAIDLTVPALTVISDRPGVVDEELTLALVEGGEHVDVRVRVIATSPQVINGTLCHQLRLEVLAAPNASAETRTGTR